jgi:predicted nucleic acid-binding protein
MSMLIDSNIIIFSAQAQHGALRQFIAQHTPAVSAVSYIEVLGYHRLNAADKQYFEAFFATATVLPISQSIIELATKLRQQRKMTLGDALIAATCMTHNLTLVTNNIRDFSWIADLSVLDPFANTPNDAGLPPI